MPYSGEEPDIIRSDVFPVSETNVSSITSSFDNNLLVLGYQNENNNTGAIEVFEYILGTDTWNNIVKIDGPHENSYFGRSVDMEWDGQRIVVGANAACNVYVYDWDGATYQNYSNVIQSPSGLGSDFGFSVGIAKNNPNVITIGSPAHNNVFVYQLDTDTWTQTFSNIGTDIQNLAPYSNPGVQVFDTSTNLVTTPEYNRYGESVSISNDGSHIIVGQPGTVLANLNATNTTNYGIVAELQKTDGNVVVRTSHYTFDNENNINRQLGSVRVFRTQNASWSTSNAQVGGLIYGERNFVISESRQPFFSDTGGFWYVNWQNIGWSYSGHGSSVAISPDGTMIVVGAPLYGRAISYGGHSGKVYTYELGKDEFDQDVWVEINTILGSKLSRFGLNVKLDYLGTRLAVNGCDNEREILSIYDFSNLNWYNIRPDIVFLRRGPLELTLDMTDGKTVITSRIIRNTLGGNIVGNYVLFFNLELTQLFNGNSLFSGYITTPYLHVGVNDSLNQSTSQYSKDKKIAFGGTFNDNTYENTIIENRVYSGGGDGLSELILSKIPGSEESLRGLDLLRLKAMEIHLDSWNQLDEDRYDHNPILVMTVDSCIGIGHTQLDFTNTSGYYNNSIDTHARLDVNGSTFIRNKLNVNYDGRSEILGYNRSQGILFWDTRQYDTVDGTTVYSRSWPAPSKYPERASSTSTMYQDVSYSKSDCAFYFGTGTPGYVYTGNNGLLASSSERPQISFWFKIGNEQSTYTTNNTLCSYGTTTSTNNKMTMFVTTTGLQLKFYNSTSTHTVDVAYTLVKNVWYNVVCDLTQKNVTTATNLDVYINNVNTSYTVSGTPITIFLYSGQFQIGPITNAYIGMVNLWTSYVNRAPSAQQLYENGPPDELLSVGGSATIENKLGIGVTNPTNALEVAGDINFTGNLYRNDSVFSPGVDAIATLGPWPDDTLEMSLYHSDVDGFNSYALKQTSDGGTTLNSNVTGLILSYQNTEKMRVHSNGNVGIGTSAPNYTLDVAGNINFSGTAYQNGVPISTSNVPPTFALRITSVSVPGSGGSYFLASIIGYDSNGWWDNTQRWYFPQTAGWYQFNWNVVFALTTSNGVDEVYAGLEKNNQWEAWGVNYQPSFQHFNCSVGNALVYLNGSTDFVRLTFYNNTGGQAFVNPNASFPSSFSGHLVRQA